MRESGAQAAKRLQWRQEILIFLATLLLMLWLLAVNGAPFYAADSASYLRGGAFGFHTGLLMVQDWWQSLFGATPAAGGSSPESAVAGAIANAGGARSIIYSLFTYVFRFPGATLLGVAVAQAAAVALILSSLRSMMAADIALSASVTTGAAVALLTSASWYAAYAMPDILAGVTIAGALALTVFFDRAPFTLRLTLVALVAFCITTHGSHPLVGFGTLVTGGAAHFWLHRGTRTDALRKVIWFASPMVVGAAALLCASYAAFGEASLAPKRYPIQLARSVADGPGAWYLRDHCATEHYAICEIYGPNPPRKVNDFLWGSNGVRLRATPEQMDRIRAEESIIVRRAAMAYPAEQIRRSARNSFAQFFEFGLHGLVFGGRMVAGEDPSVIQSSTDKPGLRKAGEAIIYAGFFGAVVLLWILRRRLTRTEIAAISVAVAGLAANAIVCGVLSAVTDRYQGRVSWVLPALVIIIAARIWSESRSAAMRPS